MRYWENVEVPGRGTKYCLVMDPEDGTHPIKTYGWSKDEVLEKVAKTAEAAQALINRQRNQPAQSGAPQAGSPAQFPAAATSAGPKRLTADERMQATVDLNNPARSAEAVKALLSDAGVDVDKMKLDADAKRAAGIAQEWERSHPEFPSEERNQRLLMNTVLLRASGNLAQITAEMFDSAYNELVHFGMLFDSGENPSSNPPQNAPDGSSATRTVRPRGATSYRSTNFRASVPGARREPKYTRTEIEAMPSTVFREKVEREPGFREWYDREFSAATA